MFRVILSLCLFFGIAFAQDTPVEPQRFAVYVSGAEDATINKSLASKLIADIMQNNKYLEILEAESFYDDVSKNAKFNVGNIVQVANKADMVFLVNLTESLGQYSVSARLIEKGDIVKTVALDLTLKTLDDLNSLSKEIVSKLVQPKAAAAPKSVAKEQVVEQCTSKYNINKVTYDIKEGFTSGFKGCATDLVKETLLAKSPFAKKPAPEPKSFIMQCIMGNIDKKLEGVPSGKKITTTVQNFLETLLKAALSGGDPKALISAAANLNINEMMETINNFGKNSDCFVNEPYTPPAPPKKSAPVTSTSEPSKRVGRHNNGYCAFCKSSSSSSEESKNLSEESGFDEVEDNFSVGQRFGTIILNFIPGVGSGLIMNDITGELIQWGLAGCGAALTVVGVESRNENYVSLGYVSLGVAMLASWQIYSIVRAITYDKPHQEVTHSKKYGNLNMAVLPTRNGNGMAYGVMYNLGF